MMLGQLGRKLNFHANLLFHCFTNSYHTFVAASIKLLGKMVRCRTNVLYHLLKKIGKEPNADLFPFMEDNSHQQTEGEIKLVFEHLG